MIFKSIPPQKGREVPCSKSLENARSHKPRQSSFLQDHSLKRADELGIPNMEVIESTQHVSNLSECVGGTSKATGAQWNVSGSSVIIKFLACKDE